MTFSNAPLITIVTPVRNAKLYIGEMLGSVARQDEVPLEHIVFDAGSADGTRELLARRAELRLFFEEDAGAHDAMNRGVMRARGDIVGFANADDLYAPGALRAALERFACDPALDVLMGRSHVFTDDQRNRRTVLQHALIGDGGLDLIGLMYGIPALNARFFRRRVFDRIGLFDLRFYIAADRHFLLRAALAGLRGAVLDFPVYCYRQHAASQTVNGEKRHAAAIGREHIAIAEDLMHSDLVDDDRRRLLRQWLAYETARAGWRDVRGGGWRTAGGRICEMIAKQRGTFAALPGGIQQKLKVRRAQGRIQAESLSMPPKSNLR